MRISFREAMKSIQAGKLHPVYFLNGDDFFLQNFFIQQVEKAMAKKVKPERICLVPETGGYEVILAELNSISLFPQPKLFVLQNPLQIKGKPRGELLEYCKFPNGDNCIIIVIDKYDRQSKLIKKLTEILGSINVFPPFPQQMAGWAKFLFDERRLKASQAAVETLVELSGDTVYHMANEIEKIELGLGDRTTVEEEDVLRYAGWKRDFFPWQFQNAVGSRDFARAVLTGKNLLAQGLDATMLISLMAAMFQELLFRHMRDSSERDVGARELWLSKPVKQKLPDYQKLYKKGDVTNILRLLAEADRRVKSSGVDSYSILMPLVYRITTTGG